MFICARDVDVADRLVGAVGGVVSPPEDPDARNATICMIHGPAALKDAEEL
jgi:hypothetical protein